ERPERARPLTPQPRPAAGEGKVLAREGGPRQIGRAGQIARVQRPNVRRFQYVATPILPVDGTFLVVEVVSEQTFPLRPKPSPCHPAACKELVKCVHPCRWSSPILAP